MMIKQLTIATFRLLIGTTCLCMVLGLQAFAEPQLEQPTAVAAEQVVVDVEQDQQVTPTGCTDSCCGGDSCCAGNGCCGSCCCEPTCCPKLVKEEVKKHCWKVNPEMICIPGFRFECNWRKAKCCKSGCADGCCGDTCCGDACCGQSCCRKDPGTPTCGRVRCINVLEKHEYTCEECGYEWEVKCVRSGNGCCRGGGCCCPSCGAAGCCASTDATESDVQLTSAQEATDAKTDTSSTSEDKKPSLASRFMSWLK